MILESILPRAIDCKHAFEIWDTFHKCFQSHLKTKMHRFWCELKNINKGSRSIFECVPRIKAIANSLLSIGDPITEQYQIDAMLEGLSEEYSNFFMTI